MENFEPDRSAQSIYHPHRKEFQELDFLVGDNNKGWRAQRNLTKALNHLELLKSKEEITKKLGLHNIHTEEKLFENNYKILEDHKNNKISTTNAIEQIAMNSGLPAGEVTSLLEDYFPVGHLEFHPSDRCNLRCKGCTYGQDLDGLRPPQIVFPFEYLDKLAALNPRSILHVGGGEPTLYYDKGHNLGDLINKVHELMPKTAQALVTNGTSFPKGDWTNNLSWARISIDAATPQTYELLRGKPFFSEVEKNILKYLKTGIPQVGGTFLYSKLNIHEYTDFVKYFFNLVKTNQPENISRLNLSYRPLRKSKTAISREFPESISEEDIKNTVKNIIDYAHTSPEVEKFLREQTNVEAVLGGNIQPAMSFNRCNYSQIFHIVRANGDVMPCFVKVLDPEFTLGNIIADSPTKISLNTIYTGTKMKRDCNPEGCIQCHVNYVLEQGLEGKMFQNKNPIVAQDPFF